MKTEKQIRKELDNIVKFISDLEERPLPQVLHILKKNKELLEWVLNDDAPPLHKDEA